MTKHTLLLASAVAFAAFTGAAAAADKTLAIVVKGLDNPFFEQINKGCQKWNDENQGKGYTCLYTAPRRAPTRWARSRSSRIS